MILVGGVPVVAVVVGVAGMGVIGERGEGGGRGASLWLPTWWYWRRWRLCPHVIGAVVIGSAVVRVRPTMTGIGSAANEPGHIADTSSAPYPPPSARTPAAPSAIEMRWDMPPLWASARPIRTPLPPRVPLVVKALGHCSVRCPVPHDSTRAVAGMGIVDMILVLVVVVGGRADAGAQRRRWRPAAGAGVGGGGDGGGGSTAGGGGDDGPSSLQVP